MAASSVVQRLARAGLFVCAALLCGPAARGQNLQWFDAYTVGGLALGPDGAMWFPDGYDSRPRLVGRIDTSGFITTFPLPEGAVSCTGIVSGAEGHLWLTDHRAGRIYRMTTSGAVVQYSAFADAITADPDGGAWFTDPVTNKIGRVTTSGSITEISLPTRTSGLTGIAAGAAPSPCVADSTTLCLSDGRFRVTANWRLPDGSTGPGQAMTLTANSGFFWFVDPTNVELVVKVLNGCRVNGDRWVFAAGLTNVEVGLNVTDTATGTIRTYTNRQGTPFSPIQDTSAFASCP